MITFLLSGTESFLRYSLPDELVDEADLAGMKISDENLGCLSSIVGVAQGVAPGVAQGVASEATEAAYDGGGDVGHSGLQSGSRRVDDLLYSEGQGVEQVEGIVSIVGPSY